MYHTGRLTLEQVLPLRALVLRDGKLSPEKCVNEGDDHPDTFHTGCFSDEGVVAIATFMRENYPGYTGEGFRLRGMAVLPELQGQGLGKQALQSGIELLKKKGISYLWCNARKVAYDFYAGQAFQIISDEFDIPGIGPHKVMILEL
jgi:GNAT superfamily N-acetyltransferase